MTRAVLLTALLACCAVPVLAAPAKWTLLREAPQAKLFVDSASVRRKGDTVKLRYLIDYAKPQGDFKTAIYRSMAVQAILRCKARTIAMGESELFSGPAGGGVSVGLAKADRDDARFKPVEKDSSDEDLWAAACRPRAR